MMFTRAIAVALAVSALGASAAAAAFQDEEAKNYSKTNERFQHEYGAPEYQALLRERGTASEAELAKIALSDPERNPYGNLCVHHMDGCAGDVRFYDWDKQPGNVRQQVLWTARSGATISGHVWRVKDGPPRRPGIVITNGSVQAPEELYWGLAAALASQGYVVLTWDPQTQGRSDGPGAPPTQDENSQAQTPEAFTEGTQDAIDFFLSTPGAPFRPRNSRTQPGVNHGDKQDRRVKEGKNAAFDPLYGLLDPTHLGIAGHSLGAFGVSKVASEDHRVDTVVAWDQLRTDDSIMGGGGKPIPPRVPALGMSGDYGVGSPGGAAGVTPRPYGSAPDPQGASGASRDFSKAGLDTAQVNIRAGTHFEFAYIPNSGFGATLRGIDQVAWYTIGWFERYLKRDPLGDRMLLTNRWQRDAREGAVDPDHDGNTFSRYLRSRADFHRLDGERAHCEDLRQGCGILVDDGLGPFSLIDLAFGRRRLARGRSACAASIRAPRRLDLSRAHRRLRVRLVLRERARVRVALRHLGGRRILARRHRTLGAGRHAVFLRLHRRVRAGRARLTVRLRCASGRQAKRPRIRIVR